MSSLIPSVPSPLSIDLLVELHELTEDKAVYASRKIPHPDERLIVLKDSPEALEALKKSKNEASAAFEKAVEGVLDDLQKARYQVFYIIRECREASDSFHPWGRDQDEIFGAVRKARDDPSYCPTALKVEGEALATFQKTQGEATATFQTTHDKTNAAFQKFHDETRAAFQKTHDKAMTILQKRAKNEAVHRKNSESIAACRKAYCETSIVLEGSCKAFNFFKNSQDRTANFFEKIRKLSLVLNKAKHEARVAALKSTNESTIEASIEAAFEAAFEKVEHEAIDSKNVRDELIADLCYIDHLLASLIAMEAQTIISTQNLKDRVEALASLLEVQDEAIAPPS